MAVDGLNSRPPFLAEARKYRLSLLDEILSIFCADSVGVKARVTFDSSIVDGIRLTYWQPEAPDSMENVLEDIFGILFEEVVKARRMKLLESEVGVAKL